MDGIKLFPAEGFIVYGRNRSPFQIEPQQICHSQRVRAFGVEEAMFYDLGQHPFILTCAL